MKVLSILIPIYKTEKYLRRCLDSVLENIKKEQNQNKVEIILVDDGSPDNSGAICDEYFRLWPNSISVYHKENEGAGATRNMLLEKANGEYVWFVDSDDYIEKGSISKILAILDKYEYIEILSMSYRRFSDKCYQKLENEPQYERLVTGKEYLLKEKVSGYLWNKVYNLRFLRNNNIHFCNINSQEDCLFNVKALVVCKRMFLSSLYSYNYFQGNPNSTLQTKSKDSSNRKINDSIIAEKQMLQLKNEISDISLKEAVDKILSLHIAGFLHAAYITKVPVKKINDIIKELKSSCLYPSKLSSNIKANIFLIIANSKIVFLFICWLHNKKCKGKGIKLK